MFGLRTKLAFGFGGLLTVILVIGIQGILRVNDLGQSIGVILRENYRSVIACQQMKESLERVDSGVLFVLLGYEKKGREQVQRNLSRFDEALQAEGSNITVMGEAEAFRTLQTSFTEFQTVLKSVMDESTPAETRRAQYFTTLLPLFQSIKDTADHILQMNQENMSDANMAAREKAAQAGQRMYLLLVSGIILAAAFIYLSGRWILRPLTMLTASANEIANGNLDLVVTSSSNDEAGQLSRSFNAMASSLREYRRTNEARTLRLQKATQQALEGLSAAIVVIDRDGDIEVVTKAARAIFGLEPGALIRESPHAWMGDLVEQTLLYGHREFAEQEARIVQIFVDGQERFFRPEAIPITDGMGYGVGVTLLLHDVTGLQQQDELKRGVVATVSHQLKTPLTSIRMALYLLLDEKLGPLSPKQEELILAAREDTERLHGIVENLLDITRMQSGRVPMELQPVDAAELALSAVELFRIPAKDCGVTLTASIPAVLPQVEADPARIPHVFTNLLSNALKYTPPGGTITVSAHAAENEVRYAVSDTGCGIAAEYLNRVFEEFFRVPGQPPGADEGLGLAIAKEIVTAHGGEISVESQPEKGTTFSFSLKAKPREEFH